MSSQKRVDMRSWMRALVLGGCLAIGLAAQTDAQTEQRIDVRIHDFTFIATQAPLVLNVPAVITIRNEDSERHNFELDIPRSSLRGWPLLPRSLRN